MMKRILSGIVVLCLLFSSSAWADGLPTVEAVPGKAIFKGGVNAELIKDVNSKCGKIFHISFILRGINDDDLRTFAAAFPKARKVHIYSGKVEDLSPLAQIPGLEELNLAVDKVKDISVLAPLTKLHRLHAAFDGPPCDLRWMSGMGSLSYIHLASPSIVSLEGLPRLVRLREIALHGVKVPNLDPIVNLPFLKAIQLNGSTIGNMDALGELKHLELVCFYGAKVRDFSPLASCPALSTVIYYDTSGADYSTLGKLTQVASLEGGESELKDISWIAGLSSLRRFVAIDEDIADFSPLANTRGLRTLIIDHIRKPIGDLGFLRGKHSLVSLFMKGLNGVSNIPAIGELGGLRHLALIGINSSSGEPLDLSWLTSMKDMKNLLMRRCSLSSVNFSGMPSLISLSAMDMCTVGEPLDLSTLRGLPILKTIVLDCSHVVNFEKIEDLPSVSSVSLRKVKGVKSLEPLSRLPFLKRVTVSKGAFSKEQLAVIPEGVKIDQF